MPVYTWNDECPSRVKAGPPEPLPKTSALEGQADEIIGKADIRFWMSAVGGRADVVCQGLSGPFLANTGHCDAVGWEPSTSSEAVAPKNSIAPSCHLKIAYLTRKEIISHSKIG